MFKVEFFFFKLFVLLSVFHNVTFAMPFGKFRLLHFGIPIMLITIANNFMCIKRSMRKYSHIWLFIIGGFFYGVFSYLYSCYSSGTIRIIFSMLLNLVVFYYFIAFLECYKDKVFLIFHFLKFFSGALCILTVLQWFGALVHLVPISQVGEGFLGIGRPGLFLEDPNWMGYYIVFLYMMVDAMSKRCGMHITKKYRFLIFIGLLFMQSRILLLCFLFHYIYCVVNYRKLWIFIPFVLFLLFFFIDNSILLQILPERFVYDLTNNDNNPRLLDVENLSDEVSFYHRELYGMGWGSLGFIADDFPYRNYDTTINVWPGQIYFDFGKVGIWIFTIVFLFSLLKIKGETYKIIFLFFILNCCFHMPGYYLYSWVLLGIFVFTYKNQLKIKENEIYTL